MKRVSFLVLMSLFLAACSPAGTAANANSLNTASGDSGSQADLPDLGIAPELTNETWLNVDAPLRLANLRGKVILLDMWTFDCINCLHVLPALKGWNEQYGASGLVVIGNHYPEFEYEASLDNLKKAVTNNDIHFAVAQDNDGATWQAYKNQYWPTMYLIDKRGHLRYVHIGEGSYEQTEAVIQALLAEPDPQG
jgi:thiol-disulfide isomerase/thioredoxin